MVQKKDTELQKLSCVAFIQLFVSSSLSAQARKIGCYTKGRNMDCEGDFEDYEPEEDEEFYVYSPKSRQQEINWRLAEELYISRCMEMNFEE